MRADTDIPAEGQAAIEAGLAQYHRALHDRDNAQTESAELRVQLAELRAENEALQSRLADLESRMATLQMTRDEAVAHRLKWEGLFTSIQAQLKAFQTPAEPLIRELLPRDAYDELHHAHNGREIEPQTWGR